MDDDYALAIDISDNEISFASASDSDEDSMDDQFEEVVVGYDEEVSHQEIQFRLGGYEYQFVDDVSPSQKCPVCLLPMRDAVQTSVCGHRFCRDCLLGILRGDHPVCPNDRQEIEEEGGFFTDKAWTREILSLRVKCKQSERGCDWIGEVRHAEEHQRDCPYEDIECAGCGENIQRRLLQVHLAEECPKRVVECVFCQDEFYFIKKQEHEEIYCKRFPLVCENNCGHDEIPREEMAKHISEKCLETVVSCLYSSAGCPFQDKRAYLNEHNEASVEDHLEMAWAAFVGTKKELDSLKDLRQKFDASQKNNQRMKTSLEVCQAELNSLAQEVQHLKNSDIELKKMMKDTRKKTAEDIAKLASMVQPSEKRRVSRLINEEILPSGVNSESIRRRLESFPRRT